MSYFLILKHFFATFAVKFNTKYHEKNFINTFTDDFSTIGFFAGRC